ncbi:hypothetical protein [Bacillus cereus group sp. BfR-BA-01380]
MRFMQKNELLLTHSLTHSE